MRLMGRKPIGERAMTNSERVKRWRERRRDRMRQEAMARTAEGFWCGMKIGTLDAMVGPSKPVKGGDFVT